jgi:multidrug efflux pump subunit AcrA (membrane-fusion protein)
MRMKITVILILLIALSGASCKKKDAVAVQQAQPIEGVKVEEVMTAPLPDYYEAVGTVRARTASVLSSKIMGSIVALHVREGDRVRQGQILIEIDARDAAAQLQKARAVIQEAESALTEVEKSIEAAESAKAAAEAQSMLATSTFKRYKAMLEGKAVSKQEFDEVRTKHEIALTEATRAGKMLDVLAARKRQTLARIDQARADVANAQVYTGYSRITSPVNGLVTARQADLGFTATPGAPLLTVEDDSRYQLEASVEESQVAKIHTSDSAEVQIDALGTQEITGFVAEIVPAADPASRSYLVKIDLQTGDGLPAMKSGMYGKARFIAGQKQALSVPEKAVIQRGQLVGVYVVDEAGAARFRLIKTGKRSGERVEVLGGLNDKERIVTDRVEAVTDGSRVQ